MKHAPTGALTRASLLACASLCALSTGHAASGSWPGLTSPGFWSDTANWSGGIVADGAGNSADFSIIDVPEGLLTVSLDTPRTIGQLTFGDTDTATAGSWLIDNNFDPLNILTLSGSPVITVNGLGTGASAEISAELAGTENIAKAGAGALALSGLNTYSGGTTLNAGTLAINSATGIGTGPLTINGGALDNTSFGLVTLSTNNAQTWNSNLVFTGTQSLNMGTGAISTGGVLREVTTEAGILTLNGVLTAPAGLTKSGNGQLSLNGNNLATLNGPRLVKGGSLVLGGGQANVQNALGDTTGMLTFEGGRLALNGATGTFNSTTWGTFANPITVASGQTGTLDTFPRGAITSTVTGAGTLNLGIWGTRTDQNGNWTGFNGNLNVTAMYAPAFGDFRVNGTSQFANAKLHLGPSVYMVQLFSPPNSGALTTIQNIGELSGAAGSILTGCGNSGTGARFVAWQVGALNTNSEFAGAISNATSTTRLYKVGTGTLTLTGENTYTGNATGISGTQVNAGTLSIGNGGATGSLAGTNTAVAAGATLIFNRDNSAASSYPGILSGEGNVIKRGSGAVTLGGVNTATGGLTIEAGSIVVTNSSSLGGAANPVNFTTGNGGITTQAAGLTGSRPVSIASGVTATLASTTANDSHAFAGTIGGNGSLAIAGSGLTELAGANTYAGTTTVNSGTLVVSNASGSATSTGAVAVNAGTLGGGGTMSGAATVASGVAVKPGALTTTGSAVGTLRAGALSLAGGSTIFAEFASSSSHDKIQVLNGNGLTTAGASAGNPILVDLRVENSAVKWTTPGTYHLIEFAGSFSGNADDLFEVTPGSLQGGQTYTFGVSGNHITLTITGALPSEWQVDADGLWSTPANWLNGVPNSPGITATLGPVISAPRTLTLDSARTVGTLVFNSAQPYTIAGTATLGLNGGTSGAVVTNIQGNHVIQTPVNLVTALDVVLSSASDSLALEGNVSGSGGISKSGPGSISLGGNNSFLGNVSFASGTLSFASGGLGAGALTLDGTTLEWLGGHSQDISNRAITFGNNPVTFRMDGDVTLANDFGLTGSAAFTKDGFGTLTLAADTTFAGSTTVAAGTLRLGNGGTTGSVAHDIHLTGVDSRLVVHRSGTPAINNLITGAGGLDHVGSGTTTLGAANTFTGTTTIAAGSLVLGNALALQNSTLKYDLNGGTLGFDDEFAVTLGGLADGDGGGKDLVLDNTLAGGVALTVGGNNEVTTYGGNISGTGSLTKVGTGTLSLTGNVTHTGGTTVGIGGGLAGGLLETTATLDTSFLTVTQNGTFTQQSGAVTVAGNLDVTATASGGAWLNQFGGTIAVTGAFNMAANRVQGNVINLAGGSATADSMTLGRTGLNYSAEPLQGSLNDGLVINGGSLTLANALNIGNAGTGTNSSANARMDGGSLAVGGIVTVGLNNGGRWSVLDIGGGTFTSTEAATGIQLGGPLVGNATFIVRGGSATAERIVLGQGTNGGTHRVRVSGGELYMGAGGIADGSTSDDGQIVLAGFGTLAAKAAWSTPLAVTLSENPVIQAGDSLGNPFDIALNGPVGGSGSLTKTGDGTVTLATASSYTGNTVVGDGTLSLPAATLADAATVDIATGAVLHLGYSGTDLIGGFYIDGVKQADGTWGSLASSATHKTALITGNGILNVVSDPFLPWIGNFPVGGLTGKGDDADSDGLTNLEEFALDGDPSDGTASGKVRARIEAVGADQALVITLPVRNGASFSGLDAQSATLDGVTYTVGGSNDLTVFDQLVAEIGVSAAGLPTPLSEGWSYRTFRLAGAIGGATPRGPKGFLRATVAEAP